MVLALLVLLPFLVWSLAAYGTNIEFLPTLAPEAAEQSMANLWQAHAAIVALSIPLLVLLLEQAQTKGILGTTAGQAMVADTAIVFTMVMSLGSVVLIGMVSVYLSSDGGLVASATLSVLALALLGRGYWRSIRLLTRTRDLRQRSELILVDRLSDNVRKEFVVALANRITLEALSAWRPGAFRTRTSQDETAVIAYPHPSAEEHIDECDISHIQTRVHEGESFGLTRCTDRSRRNLDRLQRRGWILIDCSGFLGEPEERSECSTGIHPGGRRPPIRPLQQEAREIERARTQQRTRIPPVLTEVVLVVLDDELRNSSTLAVELPQPDQIDLGGHHCYSLSAPPAP